MGKVNKENTGGGTVHVWPTGTPTYAVELKTMVRGCRDFIGRFKAENFDAALNAANAKFGDTHYALDTRHSNS